MKKLYQCRLTQVSAPAITAATVAWIEERGAKVGARVEVPELGGFWTVETVCPIGVDSAWLRDKQRSDRKGMPDI